MLIGGEDIYRVPRSVEPDVRYFTQRCMAKGATERKAKEWAWRQVRKGRREPTTGA